MKRIFFLASALGLGGFASANFTYSNFNSTSGLSLQGNRTASTWTPVAVTPAYGYSAGQKVLRLTDTTYDTVNAGGEAGTAWYTTAQQVTNGFHTKFVYRGFDGQGFGFNHGADGIAFGIQSVGTTLLGSGGGSNGMDTANAVSVNFQSFSDNINLETWDPTANAGAGGHVVLQTFANAGIRRDAPHTYEVNFDGTTKAWDVYDGGVNVLHKVYDPTAILGTGGSYVGLGSGTGADVDNNDVLSWQFQSVPEPGSMVILGGLALSAVLRRRKK